MSLDLAASRRPAAHPVPFTAWEDFMAGWNWRPGEHVTVVGHTGSGKTTLLRAILRKREDAGAAITVLATKPKDKTLTAWARAASLTIVRDWPPRRPLLRTPPTIITPTGRRVPWQHRLMLWPLVQGQALGERDEGMADVFRRALHSMFWQGSWVIVSDELLFLSKNLGLERDLVTIWTQARSNDVTLVGGTQRPRFIPLEAYSQASWLFLFGENDDENLARLKGIGGMSGRELIDMVRTLPDHDVLVVDTRGRVPLVRTRVPLRSARG